MPVTADDLAVARAEMRRARIAFEDARDADDADATKQAAAFTLLTRAKWRVAELVSEWRSR